MINALNDNMPFDEFTIEQIAGDLLPDATLEQRVATGFSRNTLINREGGTDPEEDRVKRTVDRTNTLGKVWLGMTVECGQCHSHKYDPLLAERVLPAFCVLQLAGRTRYWCSVSNESAGSSTKSAMAEV